MENFSGADKKVRIIWVDLIKLFAVFLMTWGHAIMHYGIPPSDVYLVYNAGWIYSFHMPLFMIASGYVCNKILDGEMNIRRKFDQLIVPCVFVFFVQKYTHGTNNLWFLKSLFVCYILWGYIIKLSKHHSTAATSITVTALSFILYPLLQYCPVIPSWKIDFMFPFFGLGLLLRSHDQWFSKNRICLFILSGVVFMSLLYLWTPTNVWYNSFPNWFQFELQDGIKFHFDLNNLFMNLYRYVIGAFGSLFFICIAIILEKSSLHNYVAKLARWGQYSLHVYILQNLIFMLAHKFGFVLPTGNTLLYSFLLCPLTALGMVSIYITVSHMLLTKNYYINKYFFGKC